MDNRMTINRKQKWEEKQLHGRFKRLINISNKKNWTWLRKGNFKKETESLLIAAQYNAIRTNHIKARIDKQQQNSKGWLCGDRNETINHIKSKCSKLAQKEYKTRLNRVGKVIHWDMCKKFRFDHTNKWYMYNPATVLENERHKLLWDFDINTDHLISAKWPEIVFFFFFFFWPGCSSRHFTVYTKTKNQTTNRGCKKETYKHGFRTTKLCFVV